ncbi:hypothetical protein CEP53_012895 [Fusarium sp. AF-6]|nr:hypothetical protein CEP53_012895 [Fusarium sp. AF-6]
MSREECSDVPTDNPECDGVDDLPSDAVVFDEEEPASRDYTPSPDDSTNPTTFNLENLLLGEELKRLRVWKATFSNDELNCLPFIEHEVAQGVLKCLIGMANTLTRGYSTRQVSAESGDLEKSMRHLVEQVEARISATNLEDEAMTDYGDGSETQGSTFNVENETPLKALRFDIDRLQMLSQSLRLGLSNGIILAGNG